MCAQRQRFRSTTSKIGRSQFQSEAQPANGNDELLLRARRAQPLPRSVHQRVDRLVGDAARLHLRPDLFDNLLPATHLARALMQVRQELKLIPRQRRTDLCSGDQHPPRRRIDLQHARFGGERLRLSPHRCRNCLSPSLPQDEDAPAPPPLAREVAGGIIPHHWLAGNLITGFFAALAAQEQPPGTVILIGPNHTNTGRARALTSDLPWSTPFGLVEPDRQHVETLVKAGLVQIGGDVLTPELIDRHYGATVRVEEDEGRVVVVPIRARLGADESLDDSADGEADDPADKPDEEILDA